MNEIKMDRKELLKIVKENLKKHLADYAEAVEDYKAGALKVATANLKIAKTGEIDKFNQIKSLPQRPVSYEKEYNRAIRMLELSIENEIVVEQDVFNQLVLDEWHWKNQFIASAMTYKSL